MKKILALILASLMLVACFAGCTEEKTDAPAADDAVVSDADVVEDTTVEDTTVEDTTTEEPAGHEFAEIGTVRVDGEGEYYVFAAIGADITANDWGLQWAGDEAAPSAAIGAVAAKANVGETVTISLKMAEPVFYTWYLSPAIVVGAADKTVDAAVTAVRMDGKDVTGRIDFAAGDAVWYEGTGNYSVEECVRLAGGYNEWGTKYTGESPAGFTTIEYDVVINSIA